LVHIWNAWTNGLCIPQLLVGSCRAAKQNAQVAATSSICKLKLNLTGSIPAQSQCEHIHSLRVALYAAQPADRQRKPRCPWLVPVVTQTEVQTTLAMRNPQETQPQATTQTRQQTSYAAEHSSTAHSSQTKTAQAINLHAVCCVLFPEGTHTCKVSSCQTDRATDRLSSTFETPPKQLSKHSEFDQCCHGALLSFI
jgi:hypothetical protein